MDLSSALGPFGPLEKPFGIGEDVAFETCTSPASSERTSYAAGSSFSDVTSTASTNPLRLLHDRLLSGEFAVDDTSSEDSKVGSGAEDVSDVAQLPATRQGTGNRRRSVHWMLRRERSRQDGGNGSGAAPTSGRASYGGSGGRRSHWLIDSQEPRPETYSSDHYTLQSIFEGTGTDLRLQSIVEGTGSEVRSVADAMPAS
mmetsp:Transcript_107643/g.213902  ORF Transcript_107643/g.213902 Transcript_107643/m.213902 type:complete len:200 (-) Transcript_107643:92-691(-)